MILPSWLFWLGSLALFVIIAAIVWVALPPGEVRHRFVSPSGAIALDVRERCAEVCERSIVVEETATGASRRTCAVPLTDERPVLLNAYPLWSANEAAVDLVHADADGVGGRFTIALDQDCAATG